MTPLILLVALLSPILLAAAFLLGRHLQRRQSTAPLLTPVTRQHFEIFQSGQVNEAAVESAKRRIRDLLERGDLDTLEASLRPGMQYIYQVRALAEIGTDTAGMILEKQLQRRLSEDQLEQAWYWIDLAGSLRAIHREESLPQLFRCAQRALEAPLGHFFAAETVCFLGFPGYLKRIETGQGRIALRILLRAMEGLRFGIPPHLLGEARLADVLDNLFENRPAGRDPLLARVALEAQRLLQRVPHLRHLVIEDQADEETLNWQLSRLAGLESTFQEYLAEAARELPRRIPNAEGKDLVDLLQAVTELRLDAGVGLLALLRKIDPKQAGQAVAALAWSKHPAVGPLLRRYARSRVRPDRRLQHKRRASPPAKPSVPPEVPYAAVLYALRGHPGTDTERLLAQAAADWDPTYRMAAIGSLGWWEPQRRREVLARLEQGRLDANAEVRQASRAALARLGERKALQWFRQGLVSADSNQVHETIQTIAAEGIFFLWPDLDRLADADDALVAYHARESLERLCETLK